MSVSSTSSSLSSATRQLPFYNLPPKLQNLLAKRVSECRGPSTFGLIGHEYETSQWLTNSRNREYVDDMCTWVVHLYGCGEKLCPRAFETKRISNRTLGEQTCGCKGPSTTKYEKIHDVGGVHSKDGVARLEFHPEDHAFGEVLDEEELLVAAARKVREHWGSDGSRSIRSCSSSGNEHNYRRGETTPDRIIVDVRKSGCYLGCESKDDTEHPVVTVEVRFWE
ncbi:hypothetical protein ONS95_008323 [Cadophora gregata]|uniref:uncharacterized protein n=1 Tax=Cadophora gregata TaxID=51156 RepID=UPI0026DADB6E|nr:uncharacterized protein ONS95_008323 [Cadophora gregata]KAK0100369.1 hypothetical protein ONS96_007649 [Cadophora gregata f. sp. sojae]KAK0126743.1 hypothetical protein ONS95_008323 [Cadophora gregata]